MKEATTRNDAKQTAAYRLPAWLVRAVKFDAARQGVSYSRLAEAILASGVSPASRAQAKEREHDPALN